MGSARLTTGIMLKMVLVNLIRLNARVLRFDKQAVFYQRTTVQLPLNWCDYEIRRRRLGVTIFGKAVLHFNSSVNKPEETQKINV